MGILVTQKTLQGLLGRHESVSVEYFYQSEGNPENNVVGNIHTSSVYCHLIRALVFVCHDVENSEKVIEKPYSKQVKISTFVHAENAFSWRCKSE